MWKFGYISFMYTISLLGTINLISKVSNLIWNLTPVKKAALAAELCNLTLSFFMNSITSSSSDSNSLSSNWLSSGSSCSVGRAEPTNFAYFARKNASEGFIPRAFCWIFKRWEQISPLLARLKRTYQRTSINQSRIIAFFFKEMLLDYGYYFSASIIVWMRIVGR